MSIDYQGRIQHSVYDDCLNYDPILSKPSKAKSVKLGTLYACAALHGGTRCHECTNRREEKKGDSVPVEKKEVHLNRHKKYISIDTETGGFDPKRKDILSIGYVVTDEALNTIEKGEILIYGRKWRVDQGALDVNKINLKEHNKVAMSRKEAVISFQTLIARHWDNNHPTIIGQNVPFDVKFIKALFKSVRQEFKPDYSCIDLKVLWQTLVALGKVNTPNAKQDTILDHLGIGTEGQRHSALVDAENVLEALLIIKKYIKVF